MRDLWLSILLLFPLASMGAPSASPIAVPGQKFTAASRFGAEAFPAYVSRTHADDLAQMLLALDRVRAEDPQVNGAMALDALRAVTFIDGVLAAFIHGHDAGETEAASRYMARAFPMICTTGLHDMRPLLGAIKAKLEILSTEERKQTDAVGLVIDAAFSSGLLFRCPTTDGHPVR